MQYNFGVGNLYTAPTIASGLQPRKFGALQDVSVDMSFDIKELHGQYQFPLDVARGKGKVSIKAKNADIFADVFNQVFFGQTLAAGMINVAENEAHSVPATPGPYTVQVTNHATFISDLGVKIAGVQATRVSSVTASGQYSVDPTTGTYTFYSGDQAAAVTITYNYTGNTGHEIVVANQLMGTAPSFAIQLVTTKDSKQLSILFPKCISSKLSIPMKLDDYTVPDIEFAAFDDGTGTIMTLGTTQ